ncbi:ABC transporter substrate-binding protein [Nonomuraea gerenzanensis]|uniref:Organosulfonate ABC transporter substrate-binding protein n=2 Tax=Nonomuraea gerenzanensis TaxID=93944 RepID=A0A1M4EAE6_9ACTN|nr:ABC transporter substrate-binding protein [Nonomuraea gerenzanensis]UBU17895.1 ABC transporter substrate-binding protein [Nonomuraea gerenzanensis]SBO95688.1 Organosulfonate ABC transporter substrate-binding protein [Nonomuraea gerenzanensis]
MRVFLAALALLAAAGCSVAGAAGGTGKIKVVIGYQSKTINTVTAGTLLRSLGYLEQRLGDRYAVEWQDYDTGAPITAKMVAGKIDIGSMGDYPLLINAARTQAIPAARTELISITGYNLRGGLNMVVVPPASKARTLADLKGAKVSASVGSAGHGTLVQAVERAGVTGIEVVNHQPAVGASQLESGGVQAYAQFVAWPGLLVFQDKGRLLYDGSALDVPTFHGVVVRRAYAGEHPDVVDAFLKAQLDATRYLHEHPLAAAESVARSTGLPAEVVYLYNGPGGISTFDVTLKPQLKAAHEHDVPYLKRIGTDFPGVDVSAFVNDSYLRRAYGPAYDQDVATTANPAPITGTDPVCGGQVSDPGTASELWLDGADTTRPAATPTCLLRQIAAAGPAAVRAAYVPDTVTGTRWFADHAVWLREGARFLPFTTQDGADAYRGEHPEAEPITYEAALKAAAKGGDT